MIVRNLTMSFGIESLFSNVNITIPNNEKVGVIGINGAGKTTFFKIILGMIEPDSGTIILENNERIGYLPQIIKDDVPDMDITVLDFLVSARPISELNAKLQEAYAQLAAVSEEERKRLYKKIEKIEQDLDYWEQYSAEGTLKKIIEGLHMSDELLLQPLSTLSGGQKSKIAFARLLYSKPEILLLDEPTNHLDLETKEYITNYLKNYHGSVYIISHDVDFLNQIATKILLLDKRTHSFELFTGNYDNYLKLYLEREKALTKLAEAQDKEEAKLVDIVQKYSNSSGNRKRMAQDREKKLIKLREKRVYTKPKQKSVKLDLAIADVTNDMPLRIKDLSFRYDKSSGKEVINGLSLEVYNGEKFLVIGENGVGKSTLLKLIYGLLIPDEGEIFLGNKTKIGYYAQEHELLDEGKTILENFLNTGMSIKALRSFLGKFLFFGDDVYKKVKILSPGERSRVALAKIAISGSNFLLLDEPTNHLDPETQVIIAEAFSTFNGAMMVVSHNLDFIDNLGISRFLVLPEGKIMYYDRKFIEHFNSKHQK